MTRDDTGATRGGKGHYTVREIIRENEALNMADMNLDTFNDIGDEIDAQQARGFRKGNSHLFALMHFLDEVSSAMGDREDHKDEGEHVQQEIKQRLRGALISLAARAWIAIDELDEE